MEELIHPYIERIAANPRYGYFVAGSLLLFWLIGVICGWKWTYELSTWKENWIREPFGEGMMRIGVGLLLVCFSRSLSSYVISNFRSEMCR